MAIFDVRPNPEGKMSQEERIKLHQAYRDHLKKLKKEKKAK